MKKVNILCAGLAAAVAASALGAFGAGEGASQKWTKMYVEDSISNALAYVECYVSNAIANSVASLVANAKTTTSNGVTTISVGEGKNRMWFSYEEASVDALVATNATDAASEFGITNGFLFVWDGDGTYINGNGETIVTYTNRNCLTWREIDSAVTNGFETFEENFAVLRTMLQPSVALAVTNGLRVAEAKMSVFDILGSLLIGAVYAEEPGNLPQSAKDWYTPRNFQKENVYGTISTFNNETGEYETKTIKYNELNVDQMIEMFGINSNEGRLAAEAMQTAVEADEKAQLADAEVKQIAENLAALDWSTLDAEVKDTSSGATSSGSIEKVVEKANEKTIVVKAPGILSGGAQVDGKTIVTNSSGKLALNNIPNVGISYGTKGYYFPYYSDGLTLKWWDSIELVDKQSLQWRTNKSPYTFVGWCIKGWYDQDSCQEKLSDMMTSDADDHVTQRGKHEILCRYGGKNGEIHYLPLGGLIAADETTVSLKEEGSANGKFAIKGAYDSSNKDKALFSTGSGIEWRTTGGGIKVIGTDGNSNWPKDDTDTPAQTITFASASDSNVKVTVTGDKTSATVTIGVYYK